MGEGKSGMLFFRSADNRFVIKTLKQSELKTLLALLPAYFSHMASQRRSLISRFYGKSLGEGWGLGAFKVVSIVHGRLPLRFVNQTVWWEKGGGVHLWLDGQAEREMRCAAFGCTPILEVTFQQMIIAILNRRSHACPAVPLDAAPSGLYKIAPQWSRRFKSAHLAETIIVVMDNVFGRTSAVLNVPTLTLTLQPSLSFAHTPPPHFVGAPAAQVPTQSSNHLTEPLVARCRR